MCNFECTRQAQHRADEQLRLHRELMEQAEADQKRVTAEKRTRLRDEFAMAALAGLCAHPAGPVSTVSGESGAQAHARAAYAYAEAMMALRS